MKKIFCFLLSLIFVMASMPFTANASENNSDVQDELITLACVIFPEYADRITNPVTTARTRSIGARELVITETRAVSENEYLTYTEYSDGLVLLTDNDFECSLSVTDRILGTTKTDVTATITATCNLTSGYFRLSGVQYSLYKQGYDTINSTGSSSRSGNCIYAGLNSSVLTESAGRCAHLSYVLSFKIGNSAGDIVQSYLTLSVGNNTASVTNVEYP
jgi:hypothetical protein